MPAIEGVHATEVEGKVTLSNGETVEFNILPDYGWNQWGNREDVLYVSMPLVEAMSNAALEQGSLREREDDE